MRVLVIGSGAREHALCWKLRQSPQVDYLACAPGNIALSREAECVPVRVDDIQALAGFAKSARIDLTVVGPEQPLALGVVDAFREAGLAIFGPSSAAAQLEASKSFAKEVMVAAGVPTARYRVFTEQADAKSWIIQENIPYVIKVDGLAAGKGVFVCSTVDETLDALNEAFSVHRAERVVVEEFLQGVEASFIVATDGKHVVPLLPSHDYKRLREGDQGPNTGGLGSVCPTPRVPLDSVNRLVQLVIEPILREMERRGTPFSGFLYAGLMLGGDGRVSVLEYNARLGDPETQSILKMLDSDLLELLLDLTHGTSPRAVRWRQGSSVCFVHAAEGYPGPPTKGDPIAGIELAESLKNVSIFGAGVSGSSFREMKTDGGRVLSVVAYDESPEGARKLALRASDLVQFRGRQLRRDVGA